MHRQRVEHPGSSGGLSVSDAPAARDILQRHAAVGLPERGMRRL
jgi:hypothetical protein